MRANHNDVVDDLNRLMAEEAEACLRYFQMRFRLRGRGRPAAEKFFEEALKETLEHADAIAQRIRSLGHIPTLNRRTLRCRGARVSNCGGRFSTCSTA